MGPKEGTTLKLQNDTVYVIVKLSRFAVFAEMVTIEGVFKGAN